MADMFKWCYAPDAYACIAVRNNSAFAMAKEFDSQFVEFANECSRSLRPTGMVYLSYLSDNAGVETKGLANIPLPDVYRYFEDTNLRIAKLMKLATMTAS